MKLAILSLSLLFIFPAVGSLHLLPKSCSDHSSCAPRIVLFTTPGGIEYEDGDAIGRVIKRTNDEHNPGIDAGIWLRTQTTLGNVAFFCVLLEYSENASLLEQCKGEDHFAMSFGHSKKDAVFRINSLLVRQLVGGENISKELDLYGPDWKKRYEEDIHAVINGSDDSDEIAGEKVKLGMLDEFNDSYDLDFQAWAQTQRLFSYSLPRDIDEDISSFQYKLKAIFSALVVINNNKDLVASVGRHYVYRSEETAISLDRQFRWWDFVDRGAILESLMYVFDNDEYETYKSVVAEFE